METSKQENAQWEASNGHFQAMFIWNGLLLQYQQMVPLSLPQLRHTKDKKLQFWTCPMHFSMRPIMNRLSCFSKES
eukprot:14953402-Ditylum_brightwellii.AAC.1